MNSGFKHYIKNEMSLITPALPYLLRKCFLTENFENELQVNLKIYLTVILKITSTVSCS